MTTYVRLFVISELNDPDLHIEDCVVTSGLNQYLGNGGNAPATLAEAEALRRDSGAPMTGPMSSAQLITGLTKRYGFTPTNALTPAAIIAAAKPGQVLTISGHLSNFPVGHRLRAVDSQFRGGHRWAVAIDDAGPIVLDPLRPNGYPGDRATYSELSVFAQGGSGGTVAPLAKATSGGTNQGGIMLASITSHDRKIVDIPGGETQYDEDAATPAGTTQGGTGIESPCAAKLGNVVLRGYWISVSAGVFGLRFAAATRVSDPPVGTAPAAIALGPGLYKVG